MSETAAEYSVSKDTSDLEAYIDQKFIRESYDRLRPIIEDAVKRFENMPNSNSNFQMYVELEKLSLELARLALDYLAVQKGLAIKPPSPVTRQELEDTIKKLTDTRS